MINLESMTCRLCRKEIFPYPAEVEARATATCFSQCYYVCKTPGCDVAYTNGQTADARTQIFKDPLKNVPVQVRSDLLVVLQLALNVRNRPSKLAKFACETSEDALTWTFFRYAIDKGLLGSLLDVPSIRAIREAIYWGCPWPVSATSAIVPALTRILDDLGEDPRSYSEPDFIADDDKLLLFIEVKYGAANDKKPADYVNFPRYLSKVNDRFIVPEADVRAAGYYELVRNWVVGNLLAAQLGRTFLLINLAKENCRNSATEFAKSLREPERFRFVDWGSAISRLPTDTERWLMTYLDSKRLTQRMRTGSGVQHGQT